MMVGQSRGRQKNFPFPWKLAWKISSFIAFILILYYSVQYIRSANFFPIAEVKVIGVQHADRSEVQQLLIPLVHKDFFAVNVGTVKDRLLQMAWVADASVRRVWPDQVVIQVTEREPLARWNKLSLLSTHGELFTPPITSYPTNLPEFAGQEGEQIQIMHYFERINSLLVPLHFKITRLELTPAQAWNITLDNGVKLSIGYKDVLTRISQFVKVYPKIVGERASKVDYIDLRYSNGLAVRWKTVT